VVLQARSIEDAIASANDSELGLTASVWSRNRARARRIADRLEAGSVMINDHMMSHGLAETPWGGFKKSGFGRTHGRTGFDEMTRVRVVVDDILPFVKKGMWALPYSEKVYRGLKGIVELVSGKGLFRRLSGLVRTIGVALRYFRKG
jgi:succinate-semialdehyde dehydrogenase/glutarate-semialdehyde dehydrogenase